MTLWSDRLNYPGLVTVGGMSARLTSTPARPHTEPVRQQATWPNLALLTPIAEARAKIETWPCDSTLIGLDS